MLDTASGKPAAGVRVVLRRAGEAAAIVETTTNADGRVDKPLLDGDAFKPGTYEIAFHIGDYFRSKGASDAEPTFLDIVPVRFSAEAGRNYHLPLLISPFGYSTYRGS